MEAYGGPAQPSPTIGQCLNGGLGWLEVECKRCKTRAGLPLDAIRRPRNTHPDENRQWDSTQTCQGLPSREDGRLDLVSNPSDPFEPRQSGRNRPRRIVILKAQSN